MFGFLAGALGFAPRGLQQQLVVLAVQAGQFGAGGSGGGGQFGDLDPALGNVQGALALAAAGIGQGGHRFLGFHLLERGQPTQRRIGAQGVDPCLQAQRIGVVGGPRRGGQRQQQAGGKGGPGHGAPSAGSSSERRSSAISAWRCASAASAWARSLRARARSASAATSRASCSA